MIISLNINSALLLATVGSSVIAEPERAAPRPHVEPMKPDRIVGGVDAIEGDFPYFVHTVGGGCGGALVTDQWVLSAAHCGTMNGQVYIGPYNVCWNGGNCPNGVPATCVEYYPHPDYNGATSANDFSLCKLSEPVAIDTSQITFEMNFDSSIPAVGSDVIAIGLGTLYSGGPLATELQNVTVTAISNEECQNAYELEVISDDMLCAGVPGGGKDSCQGDSGGPLIQEFYNGDGTFTHKHIGVVSWGYGCALAEYPGVYARTSEGEIFIKNTICAPGQTNLPDFCDGFEPLSLAPTVAPCDDQALSLNVDVFPDDWPSEISYTLTEAGSSTPLMSVEQGDVTAGFNEVFSQFTCLQPSTCYEFVIEDSYGDGLMNTDIGFYQLTLDGYVVGAGKDYGLEDTVEFCLDGQGKVIKDDICIGAPKNVELTIRPDYWATETGYTVKFYSSRHAEQEVINVNVGELITPYYPYQHKGCLPRGTHQDPGCLEFQFTDSYGDGIIPAPNTGYSVVMDDEEVFSSTEFTYSAQHNFCADLGCSEEYQTTFVCHADDEGEDVVKSCGYAFFLANQPMTCDDEVHMPMTTLSEICPDRKSVV